MKATGAPPAPRGSRWGSSAAARPVRKRAWRLGWFLLAAALLLQWIASRSPLLVERYFSRGLYPRVAPFLQESSARLPCSAAELLLLALCAYLGWRLVRGIQAWGRGDASLGRLLLRGAGFLLAASGWIYLTFLGVWGLQYQRPTWAQERQLDLRPPRPEELLFLFHKTVDSATAARASLPLDERGEVSYPEGLDPLLAQAALGFAALSPRTGVAPPPAALKKAWLSPLLTRLGVTGIYIPWTGEPHWNSQYTHAALPFVACHELAHAAGYAREDEANLLGWLACRAHPDPLFRYAGELIALSYILGPLEAADPLQFRELLQRIPEGMRADFRALERFGRRDSLASIGDPVRDLFLRSQGDPDGVASYARFLLLLVGETRAEALGRPR